MAQAIAVKFLSPAIILARVGSYLFRMLDRRGEEIMLQSREAVYSVEHFYPRHPEHSIAPLTADFHGYFREEGIEKSHLRQRASSLKAIRWSRCFGMSLRWKAWRSWALVISLGAVFS